MLHFTQFFLYFAFYKYFNLAVNRFPLNKIPFYIRNRIKRHVYQLPLLVIYGAKYKKILCNCFIIARNDHTVQTQLCRITTSKKHIESHIDWIPSFKKVKAFREIIKANYTIMINNIYLC